MKISELPKDKNLQGITIKHNRKKWVLAHAWPCGEESIGMFLVEPREWHGSRKQLHPAYLSREKFFDLQVL